MLCTKCDVALIILILMDYATDKSMHLVSLVGYTTVRTLQNYAGGKKKIYLRALSCKSEIATLLFTLMHTHIHSTCTTAFTCT